jgi:EAL and modified HD-GYP domain-containing signal transduction protein
LQEIFLGRQPILDRSQNLVAYELLFRSGTSLEADVIDDVSASASVIVNAYTELGLENVLGKKRGFINVNAELLMSDMIHLLPKKQVVLELLETITITNQVVNRCDELRRAGYQLALDDVVEMTDPIKRLLPLVNIVKIDLLGVAEGALMNLFGQLKSRRVLLLAEKVESIEQARQCREIGFDMFQGYHFARPQVITGKRADPSQLGLLRLLELVMSDAETVIIEQELKRYPTLTFNLVRMVNSAASGLSHEIDSLKQAIVALGRKQLQRWVQLLLYTLGGADIQKADALMQTATIRGKMMELIAMDQHPHDHQYHDRAFMAGILSLLDTLLGIPMPEIVAQINLANEVKLALLSRRGDLGRLLMLLERKESNDIEATSKILTEIGFLSMGELTIVELKALRWAAELDESRH